MPWNMPWSQFLIQPVTAINESVTPGYKTYHSPYFSKPDVISFEPSSIYLPEYQISVIIRIFFSPTQNHTRITGLHCSRNSGKGPIISLWMDIDFIPIDSSPKVTSDCGYSGGQDRDEWSRPLFGVPLSSLGGAANPHPGLCTQMGPR